MTRDPSHIALHRVDRSKNMARFYAIDVERELFGRVVLARRWSRIGTGGRMRLEAHRGEGEALAALMKLTASKRRRGYSPI